MDKEHDLENKILAPTAAKLKKVRSKAYLIRSIEVSTFFALLASTLFLFIWGREVFFELSSILKKAATMAGTVDIQSKEFYEFQVSLLKSIIKSILPIFLLGFSTVILAIFLQNGFSFKYFMSKPKLNFIGPARFMEDLFSKKSIEEVVLFFLKIAAIVSVLFFCLPSFILHFNEKGYRSASDVLSLVYSFSVSMFIYLSVVAGLIAFIDYLYKKMSYNKSIMMSRKEMQDELKEEEIDPAIRSSRKKFFDVQKERRLNALIASSNMLISSSKRICIILKYQLEEMKAPIVLLKNAGLDFELINELAKKNNKMIIKNNSLADSLYKNSTINSCIPSDLYESVAIELSSAFTNKLQKGVSDYA